MDLINQNLTLVQGNKTLNWKNFSDYPALVLYYSGSFDKTLNWIKVNQTKATDFHIINPQNGKPTIADIRELKQKLITSSFGHDLFIVRADILTTVVQNSLLKSLEELSETKQIVILTRPAAELIPTVRSRVMVAQLIDKTNTSGTLLNKLKSQSVGERLDWWEELSAQNQFGQLLNEFLVDPEFASLAVSDQKKWLQLARGYTDNTILPKYLYELLCISVK
jgi:hypothetical protein